jgi:hypothetical protein
MTSQSKQIRLNSGVARGRDLPSLLKDPYPAPPLATFPRSSSLSCTLILASNMSLRQQRLMVIGGKFCIGEKDTDTDPARAKLPPYRNWLIPVAETAVDASE